MKGFILALQYLTRVRIYNGAFDELVFGRSTIFFPVIGALIGLLLFMAYVLYQLVFPQPVISAMMIATMVVITGGIHLDGFMDSIDGLFSGRPREKKLEIMRDSRVGAFGVLGVMSLMLIKYACLLSMPRSIIIQVLVLTPIISRWTLSYLITVFPYARESGLGTLFKKYTGKKELFFSSFIVAILVTLVAGIAGMILWVLSLLFVHIIGCRIKYELGGLTGDTYGGMAEFIELLIYLMVFPLYKYLAMLFVLPAIGISFY